MSYEADDGRVKKIYIQRPISKARKEPAPAIVFIHGGAWKGGSASTFYPHMVYYAKLGVVAMSIDYRLLGVESPDIWGCLNDCARAVQRIKAQAVQLGIDSNRMVLCGESAGGHLALGLQVLKPDWKLDVAGLMLLNPVLDLKTPVFLHYLDTRWLIPATRKPPYDSLRILYQEKARALSPIDHPVDKLPPVLLVNGDKDAITPVDIAKQYVEKIRQAHRSCTFVALDGQSHAFAIPHYKTPEEIVIRSIDIMNEFLSNLKFIRKNIKLVPSGDPNWIPVTLKK